MPADSFIKIGDAKGSASNVNHKGEIEVLSYSICVSNASTAGHGGEGSGSGKAMVSDFNFVKNADKSSPTLFQWCAQGKHIDTVTFTARRSGGSQEIYQQIVLTDCYVTSVQASGSDGSGTMESISLSFGKIVTSYWPQKKDGSQGEKVEGIWDIKGVQNK